MNSGPPWPQALLEVCLCSGAPTQLLVAGALAVAGLRPGPEGDFSLALLVSLTSIDTVIIVGLVFTLLVAGGESPRQVLLGTRPILGEVLRGFGLLLWVFVLFAVTAVVIVRWAPWLVTPNPLATLATTRGEFILLAVVAMIAGGLREEIQRAFILHRCEQRLGGLLGRVVGALGVGVGVPEHHERRVGAIVGLIGFGILFGLGHLVQGWSAVIITGLLGTLWGAVYLLRRSIVAPMVSHASFNLIEVIGFGLLA